MQVCSILQGVLSYLSSLSEGLMSQLKKVRSIVASSVYIANLIIFVMRIKECARVGCNLLQKIINLPAAVMLAPHEPPNQWLVTMHCISLCRTRYITVWLTFLYPGLTTSFQFEFNFYFFFKIFI